MQNNTFFNDSCSNNVIVVDEVTSTNDYLKNLLTKVKPLAPFTVIMAKSQTAGKGQRGNVWNSEPNMNLTASYLLYPDNLSISKQFLLTIVSSLAVYDAIQQYNPKDVSIKWPNDILIKNKKIAGILIENKIAQQQIKNSIVGIGVNVLQQEFPHEIRHKTTSLHLENPQHKISILDLALSIQRNLEKYQKLAQTDSKSILERYNQHLYNRGIWADYEYEGKTVVGRIIEVNLDGLLNIEMEGVIQKIDLKGITYLL